MKISHFIHIPQLNIPLFKTTIGVLAVIFVMFSFMLMASSIFSMTDGAMSHCPYMDNDQGICPMTVADHVASWVSMFSAIVPFAYQVLSGIFSLILICIWLSFDNSADRLYRFKLFRYFSHHPEQTLFGYLKELFRQGILHPKLYPATA